MKKFFFSVKIYYLIYVLLAFNAFVNESGWMSAATYLLAAVGVAVVICMACRYKLFKNVWNIRLILVFLASYVLSSIMNYRYGVTENMKEIIWLLLFMVFLYASAAICTKDEMKREMKILASIWVTVVSVFNLISISMVVWGREYGIYLFSNGKAAGYKEVGFKWGRLWGVYDDPNHGAAIAAAAFLLALYLFGEVRNRGVKCLILLSMAVQVIYIALSDSRTGIIILSLSLLIWIAVLMYGKGRETGKSFSRALLIGLAVGVAAAGITAGGIMAFKQGYNVLDKKIEKLLPQKENESDKKPTAQVGRKNDIRDDASNGRLSIWQSGLEIVSTTPVWGTSFRNMTEYARQNMPDTYVIDNPEGSAYDSLHNSVMDILVSQGVIGLLIVICMVGNTLWLIKRKIGYVAQEDRRFELLCFTALLSMAAGSMFLSMVFYLNAPQTYLFWICFGYFTEILRRGEKKA